MRSASRCAGSIVLICYVLCTAHCLVLHFGAVHLLSDRLKEEPPRLCRKYSNCEIRFDEHSQKWLEPRPEIKANGYEIWRRLHSKDISNLRNAAANRTVVLLGDSITEGWARPFFSPFRYSDPKYEDGPVPSGGQLAKGVATFAIGGDRIQDLGYRLFELGGVVTLQNLSPKAVILTIGTNDFGQEEDIAVAVKEMEILVKQLQATLLSDTHFVLQAPLPRGRMPCRHTECNNTKTVWDSSNPAYSFHKQLSDVLERIVHETGSTSVFLDCSDAFLHDGKKLNAETFSPDMLHLSKLGYSAWSDCIERGTGIRVLKT